MRAIYLHIPFCRSKCAYCALYSVPGRADLLKRYVPALRREISLSAADAPVESIYFGGGTPTLLSPGMVDALLESCAAAFDLAGDAEITLEAHPGAVSRAYLHDLWRLGVNRLSFGVQSTCNETLAWAGRRHSGWFRPGRPGHSRLCQYWIYRHNPQQLPCEFRKRQF